MTMDNVPGVYTNVKTQELADFLVKTGIPKEQAQSFVGVKSTMRLELHDGNWIYDLKCPEMPGLNTLAAFKEGVETEVDNPAFGGKAKMVFTTSGPNTFKSIVTSELMGKIVFDEKYTEEGASITYNHEKSGATVAEKWTRVIDEDGWYKMYKEENLVNFNKAMGTPDDLGSDQSNFKMKVSHVGKAVQMIESCGHSEVKTVFTYDEEFQYGWPGTPNLDRTMIATRMGPGQILMLAKGSSGQSEEWRMTIKMDGTMLWEGRDKVSGQSCKMWMKKIPLFCGKFRQVSNCGFDEYGTAMGMPADMISKLKNDFESVLSMDMVGGLVHVKSTSKVMPMDMSMKFDEEYEIGMPGMESFKVIESLQGNDILSVSKGTRCTVKTLTKFTNNFAIMESEVVGLGASCKIVYERI
ncbi:hypothetical protein TCAL_15937 [Tigriopus californicus]|uniref:Uncharacterized protein n=1 Tax=Tigriopus californicus TaxID=6832 RepID=A0A553PHA2_TIGCA|nr:uncharacterized protein LOC131880328 [Tigriopus californicus]TRY77037.1 hypothetical protein TCAL_15937 [Tigriopus californicus]